MFTHTLYDSHKEPRSSVCGFQRMFHKHSPDRADWFKENINLQQFVVDLRLKGIWSWKQIQILKLKFVNICCIQ